MAIGQTLTRGNRRRRVLTEELLGSAANQPAPTEDQTTMHDGTIARRSTYTEAAAYENQARLSDLIPRRWLTIALLWFFGVALVAALVGLHLHEADLAAMLGQAHLPALDLASLRDGMTGGVGVWFASSVLGLAAMACLLIYSIRRYRIDDYHGRYRIWLWIAAICLLLSVNTTADLHVPLVRAGIEQTGWSALVGGAVWWLVPLGVLVTTFGIRLLAEVRECRTGCLAMLAACACWTAAVVIHLGLLAVGDPSLTTPVIAGATLAGHVLLLTGLALYARHVVLDADGLLPQRQLHHDADAETADPKTAVPVKLHRNAQPSKPSACHQADRPMTASTAAKTAKSATGRRRTDLDPTPKAAPKPTGSATSKQWTDGADTAEPDEGDERPQSSSRRPSKTERKRLRKLRQRERQRQAA